MIKSKTEYFFKNLIGSYLNHHEKGDNKDIFIFATRRSGSTWLLDIIHSQRGIKYSDQPFDLGHYNPNKRILPQSQKSKMVYLNPDEELVIKKYVNSILDNKIQVDPPWNILNRDYSLFTNRYLVKILNAHALIGWFTKNFNVQIIYLIRHPIPTSLSIINRNWEIAVDAFLDNKFFNEKYLDKNQIYYAKNIMRNGTKLQILVLEWCLENLVPLNLLKKYKKDWIVVSYEELMINFEMIVDMLCKKLNLNNKKKMLKKAYKPSKTTIDESKNYIQKRDKFLMLKRWKKLVSNSKEKEIFEIVKRFDINAYRFGEFLPNKSLLNFPFIIKYDNYELSQNISEPNNDINVP